MDPSSEFHTQAIITSALPGRFSVLTLHTLNNSNCHILGLNTDSTSVTSQTL